MFKPQVSSSPLKINRRLTLKYFSNKGTYDILSNLPLSRQSLYQWDAGIQVSHELMSVALIPVFPARQLNDTDCNPSIFCGHSLKQKRRYGI